MQPLRKRGTKIVLGILSNGDITGVAQLSKQGAKDFARELAQYCKAYNLDGVCFDDEYEGAYDFTLKKLLLIGGSYDDKIKISLIYEFVDEEGRDNVRWVDVEDVKIINDGAIEGESANVNSVMNLSGLTTLEEAVEGAISYLDLLDEMDF